jgi:thiosulfate dehydrogenase [quinone] large subunit
MQDNPILPTEDEPMRTRAARHNPLTWPFRSTLTSPVWLVLRLYLASVWLQFGVAKIRGGWLSGDGLHGLLSAVASGQTPAPFPFYTRLIDVLLLGTGLDRVLSVMMPLAEVAVGLAFLTGVMLVPAAVLATVLNLNLILSGVASIHFDGRIIALQVLLLAAWRVAGYLGLGTLARRWWRHTHPRRPLPRAA